MSFLFKDFLSIQDVGEYLNQYKYSYDAEIEEDYYRLKATVLDLYHEKKLNIVFHYDDFAVIKTLRFAENLGVEEVEEEEFEQYISGYFHVKDPTSIFKGNGNLEIREGAYFYYFLYDKDKLPIYDDTDEYKIEVGRKFTSIEFGDSLAPSVIEFSDLRFPKADLDKLFNSKYDELKSVKDELADVKEQNAKLIIDKRESQTTGSFMMGTPTVKQGDPKTIEQLNQELITANTKIADLEYKLAQAELVETPTHNQKAEKQGDSLLILGAVMHCIKDAAKKNFTQDLLTQTILDRYKNVSGISKSTLDKKYSEAKNHLEQRHMP